MAGNLHYETPEKDRVPLTQKVFYGFGAFVNNLLAAAIGGMSIVLNLGLGMNPAPRFGLPLATGARSYRPSSIASRASEMGSSPPISPTQIV